MPKKKIKSIESLKEFNQTIGNNSYFNKWSEEELDNLIISDVYKILLIILDEEVVGFILLMLVVDSSEIIYVYVNEENRSKGLGTFLLKETLNYLRDKGILSIFLEVAEDNIPAKKLYKKIGFRQLGRRKNYYKNRIDALTFELNL